MNYAVFVLFGSCTNMDKIVYLLCSPKGEAYSCHFVGPSVRYLVEQITFKLLLAFK